MNRLPLLGLLLALAGVAGAAPLPPATPPPAPRILLLPPAGKAPEDREIARWQDRVRIAPDRADGYERLGWAFVAKARATLDAGYYKLAEKTADAMDARFGAGSESRLLRGHVLDSLHRFSEAEVIAHRLVSERGLPFDYALLSDALMEQGKVAPAVAACEREMALRPGLEAYSRAANLRWLTGDLPGAITAMEAAVRAGSPLDAADLAWTLSRLSGYCLQKGEVARALLLAGEALRHLPDYPLARLAKGRALLALGQASDALPDLQRAASLNPLPEYQWWLADALRSAGRAADASKVEAELRSRGEGSDPRTVALFLATRREDAAAAIRLARDEIGNRGDALTHDALAWALAAGGEYAAAEVEMRSALAGGIRDARLYLHAGEIALARGHPGEARQSFAAARPFAATLTPGESRLLRERLGSEATLARSN